MKAIALMMIVAVRLGAQGLVEPSKWAAGPQMRIAGRTLPAVAVGAYLSRSIATLGPVALSVEVDALVKKTASNDVVCTLIGPCKYFPSISNSADLMFRVSTRAADSGWRPSISLTGGFYTAQTERHGPFDTHDQMRLNGVLVGVSVGLLPRANRGFTMDATLYSYAALAGRDEMALGLRAGWKW